MSNLSKEAIIKLRKVKKAILAEPEFYNQGNFPVLAWKHDCNTPCCIAGWLAFIDCDYDAKKYNDLLRIRGSFDSNYMVESLGTNYTIANGLFSNWPDANCAAWEKPGTMAAAKSATRHIEKFIQTDGVW